MNITTVIPYWEKYKFPDENIKDRDTLTIGGHSLLERAISICNEVSQIQEVVIYSSSDRVLTSIDDNLTFKFQQREPDLDNQDVSIEDIIERFLTVTDAEIIVLVHPRCPFIKPSTIQDCINHVVSNEYESAFIATRHRKLAWFNGEPLNYSLKEQENTTNVSSVEPVILELSSVYVFTRQLFYKTRRRISKTPYIKFVGRFEGFDIESEDDYEIADLIINAGLDK